MRTDSSENLSKRGGYIISKAEREPQATIIATGTEVSLAMEAQKQLHESGIAVNVVSMPCCELFDLQPQEYKHSVLGNAPKVAVEAAAVYGWERYTGKSENVIGLNSFGASGKGDEVYKHFGITAENVVKKVRELI